MPLPLSIPAMLSVAEFAIRTVDRYAKDEITEEELDQHWARMRSDFQAAEDLWDAAGE